MFIDHTEVAIKKIKTDFERMYTIFEIFVQIIFLGVYAYSIVNNLKNLIFLIIYSILLVINLTYFILYLTRFGKSAKFKKIIEKDVKGVIDYVKLAIRAFTTILSIYELFIYEHNELSVLITIISAMAFLAQIVLKIVGKVLNNYLEFFMTGIRMDIEEIQATSVYKTIMNIANPQKTLLKVVSAPLKFLDEKRSKGDIIETQEIEEVVYDKKELKFRQDLESMVEQKKIEKQEKKQASLQLEISKIKNHWANIFKKKNS